MNIEKLRLFAFGFSIAILFNKFLYLLTKCLHIEEGLQNNILNSAAIITIACVILLCGKSLWRCNKQQLYDKFRQWLKVVAFSIVYLVVGAFAGGLGFLFTVLPIGWEISRVVVPYSWVAYEQKKKEFFKSYNLDVRYDKKLPEYKMKLAEWEKTDVAIKHEQKKCQRAFVEFIEIGIAEIAIIIGSAFCATSIIGVILLYVSTTRVLMNDVIYNGHDPIMSYRHCVEAYGISFDTLNCFITLLVCLVLCGVAFLFYKKNKRTKQRN